MLVFSQVGANGAVIGVNSAKQMWLRLGITAANPTGTSWKRINYPLGTNFEHVSAGEHAVWAITTEDIILYGNGG